MKTTSVFRVQVDPANIRENPYVDREIQDAAGKVRVYEGIHSAVHYFVLDGGKNANLPSAAPSGPVGFQGFVR